MQIHSFHFDDFLAPLHAKEFSEQFWEKKPLLISRKGKGYKGLMNLQDFNSLLFSQTTRTKRDVPWVRFINNKKQIDIETLVDAHTGILKKNKVQAAYQEGATIYLVRQEERFQPFHQLCQVFEEALGHPCGTNTFLTPPHSQGFTAHFDRYEAFIIQLEGSKHWKIWDLAEPFPLAGNDTPYHGYLPDPLYEVDLQPGDFLYLPRGFVHEASTTDQFSLHVSVAIDVFTWLDVVMELAKALPDLRRALPMQYLMQPRFEKQNNEYIQSLIPLLQQPEQLRLALKKVKSKFAKIKQTSSIVDPFIPSTPCEITPATYLKKKEGILSCLLTEGEITTLYFGEDEIAGPAFLEHSLQYILDTPSFSIMTMPDDLTVSGKKVLITNLIKAGFLVLDSCLQNNRPLA